MGDEGLLFEGLKVLDVGSWIAGPVAATMLADYGAQVIKVEPPGLGDGYRGFAAMPGVPHAAVNYTWQMDARNKRSITLNLNSEEGREVLFRLIDDCDVYVTNQPHNLRERWGLAYTDLKVRNPALIYASLTAYGEQGPERSREGFDLVAYWSRTGLMDLVRDVDAPPAHSVPGMGDHPSAVALYASIVTALLRRERTGQGSHVHGSLLANGLWSVSCVAQAKLIGADFSGYRHPTLMAFQRGLFETADGRWLQFTMVRTPEEVTRFFAVVNCAAWLEEPAFSTPEARFQHGAELIRRLRPVLKARTAAEWMQGFAQASVPAALVGVLDDLIEDAQLHANGMVQPAHPDAGMQWLIRPPVNVDGLRTAAPQPAPDLGEHTDAVLAELGYTVEDIAQMHAAGVV